jgi:tRNA A-37 threonylcarbamoyl transferase component Bud32
MFTKNVSDRSEEEIRREIELQTRASRKGLAPKILKTDRKTFIKMEKIEQMNIADMYGENFNALPTAIKEGIYTILYRLYHECDIEYVDVTPYNFIEDTTGRLWVIDFGDAIPVRRNWYINEVLMNKHLAGWNPDFA